MGATTTLKPITTRQQDLLRLIYKYRFLNRHQIQDLMGHKDKRLINVWLKDLVQKSYLSQSYSNRFPDNTKPAVYFTNLKAIQYFKTLGKPENVIQRLYRDRKQSSFFVSSKLLLADIAVELKQRATDNIQLDLSTTSDYENPENLAHFFKRVDYSADGVITRLDLSKKSTWTLIAHFMSPNYPAKMRLSKLKSSFELYKNTDWTEYTGLPTPDFVFIFFNSGQLTEIKRYLRRVREDDYKLDLLGLKAKFILASSITKVGFLKTFDSTKYHPIHVLEQRRRIESPEFPPDVEPTGKAAEIARSLGLL